MRILPGKFLIVCCNILLSLGVTGAVLAGTAPKSPGKATPVIELDGTGSSEQPAAKGGPDPLILRRATGSMRLDWLYMTRDEETGELHAAIPEPIMPATSSEATFKLFPGRELQVEFSTLYEPIVGTYSLTGSVAGDPNSFAVLTVSEGRVEGKIDAFGSAYRIQTISPAAERSGIARVEITEFNPAVLYSFEGRDLDLPGPTKASKSKNSVGVLKSGSGTKATVLILYTSSVNSERNIDSFSSSIISILNSALSTASVGKSALFAGAAQVGLTESHVCTDMNHLLDRSDGEVDNVDTLMSDYGADVALLVIDDDLVGTGDCVMPDWPEGPYSRTNFSPRGVARNFDVNNRFAVLQDDFALGDYTFAHELGHIWGASHTPFDRDGDGDTTDESTNGRYLYSRGWYDGTNWMTMMGGYEMCTGAQQFCLPRLNRFSNPDQSNCSGLDCGVDIGQDDQADMRQSLKDDWFTIRTWESDPSVPGSPSNVDVEPLLCYGSNSVTWSAPSTGGPVAEYEVYRSPDTSYSPQYLVYSGGNTWTNLNISSGQSPSYIRVRACNAGGCSSYSNGDEAATYTNGCL